MSNYWILMEIAFANIWNGADIMSEIYFVLDKINNKNYLESIDVEKRKIFKQVK